MQMVEVAPDGGELFERPGFKKPFAGMPPRPSGGASSSLPPAPPGGLLAPTPGSSLFDRYASEGAMKTLLPGETVTSKLRAAGTKLSCYLNTECNRGRSYVISLPERIDTLGEVFQIVQQKMGLDGRMLYAAELFLPDGQKITSWKQLREAAEIDTAIIVGCGEPFDATTIPQSMLSFHMHGGGRTAPKVVKKELADKKMRAAQLKADQVRASGHGLSSQAAVAARMEHAEQNRQQAAEMRHDYMNQLLARSSQQTDLLRHVQANNAKLRTDRARREQAKKSVWSADRLQDLAENRRHETSVLRERGDAEEVRFARLAAQAKQAAGLERRMSHISRSVEKAEREQRLVERLIERRTLSASAASSAPPSLRGAGSPRRALTASQATELS